MSGWKKTQINSLILYCNVVCLSLRIVLLLVVKKKKKRKPSKQTVPKSLPFFGHFHLQYMSIFRTCSSGESLVILQVCARLPGRAGFSQEAWQTLGENSSFNAPPKWSFLFSQKLQEAD
jgi:hypothetical protein